MNTLKLNHFIKPIQCTRLFHSLNGVIAEVQGTESSQMEIKYDLFELIVIYMKK